MRKALLAAGAIAIVLSGVFLVWRLIDRPTNEAVPVSPQHDYTVADVTYYLQNDPQWGSDSLGESDCRMSGSGCLVSCISSSLTAQGVETNPGQLNAAFSEHGVYSSEGDILWGNITNAVPGIRTELPNGVDTDRLEQAVAQGLLPIVKVKYKGSGYQHWVMLIGAADGEYLCMDPLNADKEPIPLSAHGGEIYRYRIVTISE